MMRLYFYTTVYLLLIGNWTAVYCQNSERPFIWIQQGDKAKIINKIETQEWAKTFYKEFKKRLDTDIIFIKNLPMIF